MKKTITVLTATRAEYGLLKPVITKLLNEDNLIIKVVVTGAHLSPEFGMTYKEIEEDGISIDEKIPILLSSDTPAGISKSMGLAMIGFADYFERSKPDMLVLLGDRYETLAVACAAMNARIPIAHLYGGETTEGAVDEACRHAITKMSYLHFTSTDAYRRRVIQLGESPDRVFNVGALGVENALNIELFTKAELEKSIDWKLNKPYAVVTFHPVTLENKTSEQQIEELLSTLAGFEDMQFIITKANADAGGRIINQRIDEFAYQHGNVRVFDSLGMKRYLSALKYAIMVIGNSSSGIVEAPSFHIPTINIGDRQKGRIQAESIINCKAVQSDIMASIEKAILIKHNDLLNIKNPYGNEHTADIIAANIEETVSGEIMLGKEFYNIDFQI